MSYTVTKLITNSWYLSAVVARNLETVSGDQITDGLDMLNDLLAIKTANRRLVPYFKLITINEIPGQETYFIPNLIEVSSCTFNIGPVRFAMQEVGRHDYFGSSRVDNVKALSFNYNMERVKGGANISVYFLPSDSYPLNIMGKFGLSEIEDLGQDLELTYDRFYIAYLRYALAEYMCEEYGLTFLPQSKEKLLEYEAVISDLSPTDFVIQKMSSLRGSGGLNWGDVNIGRGWRP